MTIEKKSGKTCVEAAKKLAKACSVDVIGWNDQIGKEFISVNGDSDKLLLLQKEMEKEGWHTWPVAEDQQGVFMDFGMFPPPLGSPKEPAIIEEPASVVYTGENFHYRGVTRSFPGYVCLASIVFFIIILGFSNRFHCLHMDFLSRVAVLLIIIVITSIIAAFFDWIVVFADYSRLNISRPLLRKNIEILLSDIKKIGFYTNSNRRGRTWKNVEVFLKSGKRVDLFLFDRVQNELVSFIKSKI